MGICSSCEATAATATAKLILPDGRLLEYAGPIRASQVLQKELGCYFICNADDMEFDGYISAVGADEELDPGQIYFALPRSMLRRRLHPEDMAALAVRASSALMKSGAVAVDTYVCKRKAVAPASGFSAGSGGELGRRNAVERRRWRRNGGRGRGFSSDLSAIPE